MAKIGLNHNVNASILRIAGCEGNRKVTLVPSEHNLVQACFRSVLSMEQRLGSSGTIQENGILMGKVSPSVFM